MNVLAIETSTDACSVALVTNDIVTEDHRVLVRGHHRELLPMIETLLGNSGVPPRTLTGVVLSAGPGSFTGLRIGASVAQGLAFAAECPIAPVSSLHVLAYGVVSPIDDSLVLATQPARPGEVYVGVYRWRNRTWLIERDDRTLAIEDAARELGNVGLAHVAGRGAGVLAAAIGASAQVSEIELPRAAHALELGLPVLADGRGVDAGHPELMYVSDTSAWRKA